MLFGSKFARFEAQWSGHSLCTALVFGALKGRSTASAVLVPASCGHGPCLWFKESVLPEVKPKRDEIRYHVRCSKRLKQSSFWCFKKKEHVQLTLSG